MSNKVKLTKSGLLEDLENGLSRQQMAEKYGLPLTQMKKAMKAANLENAKAKKISFVFEDDTQNLSETKEVEVSSVDTPASSDVLETASTPETREDEF